MLSAEEKKFIDNWENNRGKDQSIIYQLRYALPIGLALAAVILFSITSGWYQRATMVANSQSTPVVVLIAVLAVIIFWSVFSKRHNREMNEQRYKELQFKKNTPETEAGVQHEEAKHGL